MVCMLKKRINKYLAFLMLIFLSPICSFAQKSANECEDELDSKFGVGQYERSAVSECILNAMTDNASGPKSALDCESELDEKFGVGNYDRSAVSACILASLKSDIDSAVIGEKRDPGVYIQDFGISDVNHVGGVEPYITFINPKKDSNVKYFRVEMTLYNAVGDAIEDELSGARTKGLRFTGPLSYEEGESRATWGPVWYNSTGDCVKIVSLQVTFMNGRKYSFNSKTIKTALAKSLANSCKSNAR